MTVRIVTDSACDLPQQLADELGITMVPLTFSFGDEEFTDRESLTPAEFWARCSASPVLPQTAAPAPGKFAEAFSALERSGATGILVVTLSAELSATKQAAEQGAQSAQLKIPVRIVDSRSASMGEGITVIAAARLAKSGEVSNVAVLHAQCADVDAFVAQLRETYKGEIIVGYIGSVIGSHTGPGTIGVTYHVQ
jgi:DegV family protein with EDD domain